MDEVPAGVDPIQHEQRRWGEEAQKECLEAKLDSDSAVPAWADVGHKETAETQSPSNTDVNEPGQPAPFAMRRMHPREQPLACAVNPTNPRSQPRKTAWLLTNGRQSV